MSINRLVHLRQVYTNRIIRWTSTRGICQSTQHTWTTTPRMMAANNKPNASIPWSTRNKSESARTGKPPAPPSPSSSIILVSPINKVLLLHRVQTSSSFPSAHVFPGGNLEPSDGFLPTGDTNPARHGDNLAYRTGAIRELFEETGILLARESSAPDAALLSLPTSTRQQGRKAIHSNTITMNSWLTQQSPSAVLDTGALLPFTRWITPTNVPKRFTTQMYLYFLPVTETDNPALQASSDEVETMAPEWMYPYQWLDRARSGEIILFPPQFILLSFVSDHLDPSFYDTTITQSEHMSTDELEWRRRQLVKFVTTTPNATDDAVAAGSTQPAWRDKVISPTALSFTRKDGRTVLGLDKPGPELKDAKHVKGDDTRVVLVRFSKQGPREVEVMMRKDAFDQERREREAEAEAKAAAEAEARAAAEAANQSEKNGGDASEESILDKEQDPKSKL